MTEFNLETRYLVLKLADIESALDDRQKGMLEGLSRIVDSSRIARGKKALNAVVVESDWPCYDQVWALVEQQAKRDQIKALAKPGWGEAPPAAKFRAVDADGLSCWYTIRPFPNGWRWCYLNHMTKNAHTNDKHWPTIDGEFPDWKETLTARPQDKEESHG